jgi:hypothetical protein
MGELHAQHRRLEFVQAKIATDELVVVLAVGTVCPQEPQLLGQGGVTRKHHAAIAETT